MKATTMREAFEIAYNKIGAYELDREATKNAMKNYKKAKHIMEDLLNLIAYQEKRQKEQEENNCEAAHCK